MSWKSETLKEVNYLASKGVGCVLGWFHHPNTHPLYLRAELQKKCVLCKSFLRSTLCEICTLKYVICIAYSVAHVREE